MAYEYIRSGTYTLGPTDTGHLDLQGTAPGTTRPYVAVVRVGGLTAGFTFALSWLMVDGNSTNVLAWRSPDISTWSAQTGLITPIVPVITDSWLGIEIVSGTPGGVITWDLFGL